MCADKGKERSDGIAFLQVDNIGIFSVNHTGWQIKPLHYFTDILPHVKAVRD
mgnify:CR=1 FL=1